ncbi:unnamed protein product, partial [marine sediment metagenome]
WVSYASYDSGNGNTGSDHNFTCQWRDEFDSWDTVRWAKATHTWEGNNVDFIPENVVFEDGYMILCLTDSITAGHLDTNPPTVIHARASGNIVTILFSEEVESTSARAALLENPGAFNPIYRTYTQQLEPPIRDISWEEPHSNQLHDALYLQPVSVNQVLGPIVTADNEYLFMRVLGWRDRMDISEQGSKQRWNDVVERLTDRQAAQIFEQYVSEIMQGKQVQFVDHTFWRLVQALAPIYLNVTDEEKEIIKQTFWSEVDP